MDFGRLSGVRFSDAVSATESFLEGGGISVEVVERED